MKRYEQGSIGMRRDKNGPWCDYAEAQAEIEQLREELARIRDQIAKHNIAIKEAIRRGEAFEWKTLTLDS